MAQNAPAIARKALAGRRSDEPSNGKRKRIKISRESAVDGRSHGPEIFIGLVGPVGTDHDEVCRILASELVDFNYHSHPVKMSGLIHGFPRYAHLKGIKEEEKRYEEYMRAGTAIRTAFCQGSALAQQAILDVRRIRKTLHNNNDPQSTATPVKRQAYVFNSLKTPDEVKFLRETYGSHFYLLAIHSPRELRVTTLAHKIAKSHFESDQQSWRSQAEHLINIDEQEDGTKFGQNVRGTFPDADFFISATNNKKLRDGVNRFVNLIFANPFISPTSDEMAMYFAKAASMRFADLSRQVGAAITGKDGIILSTGCNEVPKAHGGMYWAGDQNDYRDFQLGQDSNAKYKDDTLVEILGRLMNSATITSDDAKQLIQGMIDDVQKQGSAGIFEGARVTNVIEFGRIVHAEMAAITQAARFGIAIGETTLFCTTFPCHVCARHIVASGVKNVVYIEPYPKSLAKELYPDSIVVDPQNTTPDLVSFRACPRRS